MKRALKRIALYPKIYGHHGSLKPESVEIAPHNHRVFINPDDDRAYKKLVMDTARGRVSRPMSFWLTHADAFQDALLLDVGANYGECAFMPRYGERQDCIPVEANPTLLPHLERSCAAHPDKTRIHVTSALVGDTEVAEVPFTYSPSWTGGGSACQTKPDGDDMVTVDLQQKTIDQIIKDAGVDTDRTLIFKMDVEGYECKALRGFDTLSTFPRSLGIIEFDTAMVSRSGEKPRAFFESLLVHFTAFRVPKRAEQPLIMASSFAELAKGAPDSDFHCDVVLVSELALLSGEWSIRESS